MRRDVLLIFPGALGDFLCFLPALCALRAEVQGFVRVVARPAWLALIEKGPFEVRSIDRSAVAQMYSRVPGEEAASLLAACAEAHSWSGHGDPQFCANLSRLGSGCRVSVWPFRGFGSQQHASEYYAACLGVRPRKPRLWRPPEAREWAAAWVARRNPEGKPIVLLHPGSGSPRKNWLGFQQLAAWCCARGAAVFELRGPAEEGRPRIESSLGVVREELPRVAALLERVATYVGNDSGITHLAAVVGTPSAAVFRAETLPHWRPPVGRVRVLAAADRCAQCDAEGVCLHRVALEAVTAAVEKLLSRFDGPVQRWQPGQ